MINRLPDLQDAQDLTGLPDECFNKFEVMD